MATAQPLPQLHTHIGIPPAGQEGAERAGRNWDCRRLRPPQHRRALRGQSGVRARGRGARPPHSPLTAPPPPAPPQRRPRPSSAPRRVPGPAPLLPVTRAQPQRRAGPSPGPGSASGLRLTEPPPEPPAHRRRCRRRPRCYVTGAGGAASRRSRPASQSRAPRAATNQRRARGHASGGRGT